jgi:uncharacterized protein YndB with AHSA1/START domain
MFKKILLVVVALVAIVLIIAAFKPSNFAVTRTATIQAPPDKVFPLINDFHNWPTWSPWEKLDPNMKRTLSGPPSGAGSVYAWEGNSKAGQGRMEITESVPASRVAIKLDFIKPMESNNRVQFGLQPNGNATTVTWTMDGPMAYPAKVMTVFMSMDKMIGSDFEIGLANMKAAAEK